MEKKLLDLLNNYADRMDDIVWENGLIRRNGYGHTREVANLSVVHAGTDSSIAYVYGKVTGAIDEKLGMQVLKGISSLQVTDSNNERFGAFRWYREESHPIDTNAAFFIMVPLAILKLFSPQSLSVPESMIIDDMLTGAYNWFSKECKNPILFYTNKIISDGALLTAIGKISGMKECKKQSREFLLRWLDYTETRGYGWGENLSRGYNGVTLQAFALIKKALDDTFQDKEILKRFEQLEEDILDTFRFYDGTEFVPTIRSYNVTGLTRMPSIINNLAGVRGFGLADGLGASGDSDLIRTLKKALIFLIYDNRLYIDEIDYSRKGYSNALTVPRTREFCIMDDKSASSWLGKSGGLGSINKFPVIDGSYQHKTWGLGWQCFPVSTIVYSKQVSFLRFNVDCGDRIRNHPHKNKHRDFLDPALFSESYYPDVKTDCKQHQNTVIAIRSINKLRNSVNRISDSFDVQRFDGELIEIETHKRSWYVLSYDNACICITSLMGIAADNEDYHMMNIEILENKEGLRLVQYMYRGDLKTLFNDRLCAGWVIHYVDKGMEKEEVQEYLTKVHVTENCIPDGKIPRIPIWNIHNVEVKFDNTEIVTFKHDPYV